MRPIIKSTKLVVIMQKTQKSVSSGLAKLLKKKNPYCPDGLTFEIYMWLSISERQWPPRILYVYVTGLEKLKLSYNFVNMCYTLSDSIEPMGEISVIG